MIIIKTVRQIFALILTLALVFALFPGMPAFAANGDFLAPDLPGLDNDDWHGDGFVAGEVLAPADSLQHAQYIAAVYGLELKSYAYGIAVLAATDAQEAVAQSMAAPSLAAQGMMMYFSGIPLPQLSLNRLYHTLGHTDIHTNAYTDVYTDAYTSAYTSAHTDAYTDVYTNGYTDAYMDAYTSVHTNAHTNSAPESATTSSAYGLEEGFYSTPEFGSQWHHTEINSERAWSISTGAGVVLAVIDTGIDINHPDFAGRISAKSYNSHTKQAGIAYVRDDYGHGTHVASIAAASLNSVAGVCGVAPGTQILAIKANMPLNPGYFEMASILRAINYAAENGAHIINMSLGRMYFLGEDELERSTIAKAVAGGVTVVCAAGNEQRKHAGYPAAYPEAIAVSALKQGGDYDADYSNYGPEIDIAAPGTAIYAAKNGGGYVNMTGTSMASPCVAGAAALVKARYPQYTPEQVRAVLRGTARQAGAAGRNDYYGWGILNAYGAALGAERLYSVSFNYNDGLRGPLTMWVVPGGKLSEPDWPERNGYVFDGWYTSAAGGARFDFSLAINADTTIYARWVNAVSGMFALEFPDANFRREVFGLLGGNKKGSDIVSAQDYNKLATTWTLNVSGEAIRDMTGLKHFSGLSTLSCSYNRISKLDVTKSTNLLTLWCTDNQLTDLNVSSNTYLTSFYCRNNLLQKLDTSYKPFLGSLDCSNNLLTELDASNYPDLTELWCSLNQLEKLDVAKNTKLTFLSCTCNQLRKLDVSNNTALVRLDCGNAPPIMAWPGDNRLEELDISKNRAIKILSCQNAKLRKVDFSNNIALEELWLGENYLTGLDISKNPKLTRLRCVENYMKSTDSVIGWQAIPALILNDTFSFYPQHGGEPPLGEDITNSFTDANFLAAIRDLIARPSGPIYDYDVFSITSLSVESRNISSLTGIEHFKNLTMLSCDLNQLTALDLSKNTKLNLLSCNGNQLRELDVSKNTALALLFCSDNCLTGLDVSKNSELTWFICSLNYMLSENSITGLAAIKNKLELFVFNMQRAVIHIITQPAPATEVTQGSINGSLSIEIIATQDTMLFYQWFRSNGPTSGGGEAVNGATSPVFSIPTNLTAGKYYYYCVALATNSVSAASAVSDAATVTVNPPTNIITLTGAILYQPSPIPATVTLYGSTGDPIVSATNTEGAYTLTVPAAPAGTTYTLVVTKPGYLSYTIWNLTLTSEVDIEAIDIRQLAGDVNGDGIVNAVDLTCLLSEFNRKPLSFANADIDGNGIVNAADLTYLLAGFNKRTVIVGD